jgi:hypothetical protein
MSYTLFELRLNSDYTLFALRFRSDPADPQTLFQLCFNSGSTPQALLELRNSDSTSKLNLNSVLTQIRPQNSVRTPFELGPTLFELGPKLCSNSV